MTSSQVSQASTLSILLWVYAGIQSLFALIFVLLILLYGVSGVVTLVSGGKNTANGAVGPLIFAVFFGVLAIGLASIILNIKAGSRLREPSPAPKLLLLASAFGNLLSFLFGGMSLAPLGIALGIYGLYFTLSDVGKAYFNGGGFQSPPPVNKYGPGTFGSYEQ